MCLCTRRFANVLCAAGRVFSTAIPSGAEETTTALVDFSYTCELTVQGRMGPTGPTRLSACEYRRYSEIDPKLAQEAGVQRLFCRTGLGWSRRPVGKGASHLRSIGRRQSASKKPKSNRKILASSIHVVLNDNGGHCITLSNAFIALCRLQGIAARASHRCPSGLPRWRGSF